MRFDWLARMRIRCRKIRRRGSLLSCPIQRLEERALLAAFTVDTTDDTPDSDLTDNLALDANGKVSLRAAIQQANALAGADTITLPAGTFSLSLMNSGFSENLAASGDLDILDGVSLIGAGATETIIDGLNQDRVFDILSGVTASIAGVKIVGGTSFSFENGGGIRNAGMLTLDNVAFVGNFASGGGGAIASTGANSSLTITDTLFEFNNSNGSLGGGAIFNSSLATITRSMLRYNTALANGGAIVNAGGGSLALDQSTIKFNDAGSTAKGGGIYNNAILTVKYSTISNNGAESGGGIANVNFSGMTSASLLLATLSTNSVTNQGGGIFSGSGTSMLISDSTIAKNSAVAEGGGIYRQLQVQLTIGGSILATNVAGTIGADLYGPMNSNGNNLIGSTLGGSGFLTNDLQNVDSFLGPLQNNGGPTFTHALLSGSPAINGNTATTSTPDDQRLMSRPVGTSADIGAFEVQPTVVSLPPSSTDVTITLGGPDIVVTDDNGTIILTVPFNPAVPLVINGTSGDDNVTIDFSNGNPIPSSGATFNGGGGSGDQLVLTNGTFDSVTHVFFNSSSGQITMQVGTTISVLNYQAVTSAIIDLLTVTNRTYQFGATADNATLNDNTNVGDGVSKLSSVSTSTPVEFSAPSASLTIVTKEGDDTLTLSAVDSLFAASVSAIGDIGNDLLDASGFALAVSLQGNVGADTLKGGSGNDDLNGHSEDDSIDGGAGNDSIKGGAGNDVLVGAMGDDAVLGQAGNDSLTGGLGNDLLDGGTGTVDVLIESADANLTLTDTQLLGIGTDTLVGIESASLTGGAGNNTLTATAFSGAGTVTLSGGGGNDTLLGSSSRVNVLNGDEGDDSLRGGSLKDTLFGGAGNDSLSGMADADKLYGEDGNDTLLGGTANDTLDGGNRIDDIDLVVESGNFNFTLTNSLLIGNGTDAVVSVEAARITGGSSANKLDASGFSGNVSLIGGAGNDTLIGGTGNDSLQGDVGSDLLKGRDGNDVLNGGNDTLTSGTDNDTLNGGSGDDLLLGGIGNDALSGYTGNDTLNGGAGADILYGGDGDDNLLGGAGNDTCLGGIGDDTINGQGGNDKLSGDGGADVFIDIADRVEGFAINPLPLWVNAT